MVLVPENQVVVEVVESVALDWAQIGTMVRERAMVAGERAVAESVSRSEGAN